MNSDVKQEPQAQTLAEPVAPLTLEMPEPAIAVREPDQAAAMIPFKDETQQQVLTQADQFIADLLALDPHSEDFRSRVDSALNPRSSAPSSPEEACCTRVSRWPSATGRTASAIA